VCFPLRCTYAFSYDICTPDVYMSDAGGGNGDHGAGDMCTTSHYCISV